MSAAGPVPGPLDDDQPYEVASLVAVVRRVIAGRVNDRALIDDLVQETLVRVLAARHRIDDDMLEPYAIVTARNVVSSAWHARERDRRNAPRVVDLRTVEPVDERLLLAEDRSAVAAALRRLPDRDRETLVAHEVIGRDMRSLADEMGSTPGAVAAQLNRSRARLRVEYLLASEHVEPPTDHCRPVLLALSTGDRRRQREVDAARHLLDCQLCATLSEPLLARRETRDDEVTVIVRADPDIVSARQAVRTLGEQVGFARTDLTVIATAVSEVARNIVRFAYAGRVTASPVESPRRGLRIVATDSGPGIEDVQRALTDGFSTYGGLGIGLPGARRLMDEFAIASEAGRGTTVTMTKWLREG